MSKLIPKAVALMIIAVFLLPFFAFGAERLVTCDGPDCNLNSIVQMVSRIIEWIIKYLAGPVAALAFAYAGVKYITAIGDSSKIKEAHNIFKNVVIGVVIILSAWLLVDFILDKLSTSAFSILK